MRRFVLSCATAHSSPASAASKAKVERTWLAALRCSNMSWRFANTATNTIANSSSIVTTSAAAPRWDRVGQGDDGMVFSSAGAGADDRVVAQSDLAAQGACH